MHVLPLRTSSRVFVVWSRHRKYRSFMCIKPVSSMGTRFNIVFCAAVTVRCVAFAFGTDSGEWVV